MGFQKITDRLRDATREIHSRLESTEYAVALQSGTMAIESYVGYLRVLTVLHGTLEPILDNTEHPALKSVWNNALRRTAFLTHDLDYFRTRLVPDLPAAIGAAQKTAADIRRLSLDDPAALIGAVFTLYGSSMGAQVLRSSIDSGLDVGDGSGGSYFARHGGEGHREWHATVHRIDSSRISESQIKSAAETAILVFQCIHDAFLALHPLNQTALRFTATTFNPESGNHPVPQEPDRLRAVLRATDRALAEYPYIRYRYGDRGQRFTDADGAWLATLPELDEDSMSRQLDWLRTVLSSRGIPHVIVARHLQLLAEELSCTSFDRAGLPLLERTAERIYRRIDQRIPLHVRRQQHSALFQSLGRGSGDPQSDIMCRETVELIASAVVDRDLGVENAVDSLTSFLADPRRFSTAWVESVLDTVQLFQVSERWE